MSLGKKKSNAVTIWLVEDERSYREALASCLELDDRVAHVESYGSYEKARASLNRQNMPDLLLMDLNLPGMNGIEGTAALLSLYPALKVLVLTSCSDQESVLDAICAGANGYLVKSDPVERIIMNIHDILDGGVPLSRSIASYILENLRSNAPSLESGASLSDVVLNGRETDILTLLANGESRQSVADAVNVSVATVDYYLRSIYEKLQVHSTAGAVGEAYRLRLID